MIYEPNSEETASISVDDRHSDSQSLVVLLRAPSGDEPDKYEAAFASAGYLPVSIPVLQTILTNISLLANIVSAGGYSGVIVTSARVCEAWKAAVQSILSLPTPNTSWFTVPFYVVGNATASALSSLHDLFPATHHHLLPSPTMIHGQESGNAEQLANFIVQDIQADGHQSNLLYLTGDKNRETLPSILNAAGLKFDPVQVYGTTGSLSFKDDLERVIGEHTRAKGALLLLSYMLRDRSYTAHTDRWIVYFAPSAAQFVTPILENYFSLPRIEASNSGSSNRPPAKVATIGPTTFTFVHGSLRLHVTATASKPSPDGLLSAIQHVEQ
ncbi:tetrapyrrole biosynthesis, uroporphyrinogen III synthase [Amanita rubescens]|nr:tetrapyrrole biosynthesis, uroporphyrinogen III synthase [Amanita rubescens]